MRAHVLFIDIMGFAQTIDTFANLDNNEYGLDDRDIDPERVFHLPPHSAPSELAKIAIRHMYNTFHTSIRRYLTSAYPSFDEMIIFSDSAFVVSTDGPGSLDVLASEMMFDCFSEGVPLRMGLALGDFVRRPFSTSSFPGGKLVTEAPFLGTAVVRAYRAQSRGCAGFRVLVHPSVEDDAYNESVPLPPDDCSEFSNRELNFLLAHMKHRELPDLGPLLAALSGMRTGISDKRAIEHFDATERTLRRLHSIGWKDDPA